MKNLLLAKTIRQAGIQQDGIQSNPFFQAFDYGYLGDGPVGNPVDKFGLMADQKGCGERRNRATVPDGSEFAVCTGPVPG